MKTVDARIFDEAVVSGPFREIVAGWFREREWISSRLEDMNELRDRGRVALLFLLRADPAHGPRADAELEAIANRLVVARPAAWAGRRIVVFLRTERIGPNGDTDDGEYELASER